MNTFQYVKKFLVNSQDLKAITFVLEMSISTQCQMFSSIYPLIKYKQDFFISFSPLTKRLSNTGILTSTLAILKRSQRKYKNIEDHSWPYKDLDFSFSMFDWRFRKISCREIDLTSMSRCSSKLHIQWNKRANNKIMGDSPHWSYLTSDYDTKHTLSI